MIINLRSILLVGVFCANASVSAFTSNLPSVRSNGVVGLGSSPSNEDSSLQNDSAMKDLMSSTRTDRRTFGSAVLGGFAAAATTASVSTPAALADDEVAEEGFESIAARASKLAGEVGERTVTRSTNMRGDTRTAFDFSMPMEGESVSMKDVVHQEYNEEGIAKVKAILVVNMKQDDPIARKDIPEFISLAAK